MAATVEINDLSILNKKLVKPDKAKHEAEIGVINAEIAKLQERLVVIRSELDAARDGRSGVSEQIQAARQKMQEIRAEKDQLMAERSQMSADLKLSQGTLDEHSKTQKNLRQEIKFTSAEEIDKQIDLLRHKQETQSMSLAEEKKVLKEMEALRKSKKLVDKYAGRQGQIEQTRESAKVIRAKLTEKGKELDAVSERIAEQKKVLDELHNSNSGAKDMVPALNEERKEIKTKLDEKFNEIRTLRAQFKEQNNTYFAALNAQREARKKAKEEEEKKMQEQYQLELAEYEKEMEKIHPYQDEMDLCDALVAYLQSTFIKPDEVVEAPSANSVATVEMDGMKPLKREEEDFMSFGGKNKGKKGGKKNKKIREKLALPIARLDSFNTIGLSPPTTISQVPDSIKEIIAKKEELSKFTRETAPKKQEETPAPQASPSKKKAASTKKNRNFDSDANASDFPSLGGAAVSQPSSGAWGPGAASVNQDAPVEDQEEEA